MVGTHTLPSLCLFVYFFVSPPPSLPFSLSFSFSFCFFFLPYPLFPSPFHSSPLPFTLSLSVSLFCFLSLSLSLSLWLDQSHEGGEEHKSPKIAACVLGLCLLVNMIGVVHSLKCSCFFLLYCYVIPPTTARFSFSVSLFSVSFQITSPLFVALQTQMLPCA